MSVRESNKPYSHEKTTSEIELPWTDITVISWKNTILHVYIERYMIDSGNNYRNKSIPYILLRI